MRSGKANPFLQLSRSSGAEIPSFLRGKSGDGAVSGPAEAVCEGRGIRGGLGGSHTWQCHEEVAPRSGTIPGVCRETLLLLPGGMGTRRGDTGWGFCLLGVTGDIQKTPLEARNAWIATLCCGAVRNIP